ncbi:FAD-dependent oxidoreductase [Clostridium felsineum]|uniref:NADH oxidase n=1 Tax=Clostridium felsineum TaxID=36839 RepID=A0A1S8LHE0_9CLOT|nr:FAD-dependent oxidoreductase [Clostridium felsineum]URZ08525.1 NADH oxidase [Clostridium felsineum]URZ13556.1 NADH oxidase [Clostridium felsineum]
MNNYENIFKPIKIGNVLVKNRIEVSPAEPFLASQDGYVTREFIEWTRTMAKGGAGIVTIGDSPVNEEYAKVSRYVIDMSKDTIVNGLYSLTEIIHRYGAKASVELNLRTNYTPTDMTKEKIKQVINDFSSAAFRCKEAGMDMVMIHGGHGHLIAQFFSPFYNKRTDEYSTSSMENRTRFAKEILDAVREKIGQDMAIEYRISADELNKNGVGVNEALEFAKLIEDKIDLIHVSVGDLYKTEVIPFMIQPTYIPRGINVYYAEAFKKVLKVPVTTVGSLDMDMAEKIISNKKADIVAMIRSFIADPNLVNKTKYGEEKTIRPCIRCTACVGQSPHAYCLPIRCAVNPMNGRELEFMNLPMPLVKKKVVVIGGGPAGMEVARDAAKRGHRVVIMEKTDELGGALKLASANLLKRDMKKYLCWAVNMTKENSNIEVRLNTEATRDNVKAENPDAVVIAVGSEVFIPKIQGIDKKNVIMAMEVQDRKKKIGDKIVVVGAGLTGSEIALELAREGKKVSLVDARGLEDIDKNSPAIATSTLRSMLSSEEVKTITGIKLKEITDKSAIFVDENLETHVISCDTVILSLGVKPRIETVREFDDLVREMYVIGDCNNENGNLMKATTEGFFAAMSI